MKEKPKFNTKRSQGSLGAKSCGKVSVRSGYFGAIQTVAEVKSSTKKEISIYLVRHGESTANIIKDTIGQATDTKLTENGKDQAKKLGQRFALKKEPDFIASSSYTRALETANIVSKEAEWNKEIYITDSLVEYNPGDWRGKRRSNIYDRPGVVERFDKLHMGFPFPNGDTLFQTQRRATTFIEDNIIYNETVLRLAEKQKVKIVLFSHGMTIKTILQYVLGFDRQFCWKIRIDNASICHLKYTDDAGWFLNSINDIGHLIH